MTDAEKLKMDLLTKAVQMLSEAVRETPGGTEALTKVVMATPGGVAVLQNILQIHGRGDL